PVLCQKAAQFAPREAGIHADGEVARLVLNHAPQGERGNLDFRRLYWPGHLSLGGISRERDGAAVRRCLAKGIREFGGLGGRQHGYSDVQERPDEKTMCRRMELRRVRTMEPIAAEKNPWTSKPG